MKPWLISVFVLLAAASITAQDNAKQLDEYGRITCEDLLARTEAFGQQLVKTPSARGVVVTYNGGKSLAWQQEFVHRVLIGIHGNDLQITFFENLDDSEPRTQIWLIPDGVVFDTSRFHPTLSIPYNPTKTLKFDSESGDPCSGHALPGFMEMLKTTNSNGRIVLGNYPRYELRGAIGLYRKDLKDAGIAIERVRFGYKTRKKQEMGWYVEYWLYPKATR